MRRSSQQKQRNPVIIIAVSVLAVIILICLSIPLFIRLLTPDTEEAENAYEVQSSLEALERGDYERETWPLIANLPFQNSLFSLGYAFSGDHPVIQVSASETYLEDALKKLNSFATAEVPLYRYDVKIKDFENPFSKPGTSDNSDPAEFLKEIFSGTNVDFSVWNGVHQAEYYYTFLSTGSEETYNLVKYTAVLKASGGSWELASIPSPIPTLYNSRSVPESILEKIYAQLL